MDFVQVRMDREHGLTMVKGVIIDRASSDEETKVSVGIMEITKIIQKATCSACPSACRHIVAFLIWIHTRSLMPKEKQSSCWGSVLPEKDAKLKVQDLFNMKNNKQIVAQIECDTVDTTGFLNECLNLLESTTDNAIYQHHLPQLAAFPSISIELILKESDTSITNHKQLLMHLEQNSSSLVCQQIDEQTVNRYKSADWMRLQFGRIRCSLCHQVSLWTKITAPLTIREHLLGMYRVENDPDRLRQKQRKRAVLPLLEAIIDEPLVPCGILIHPNYPQFCATPDAISEHFVVELKWPSTTTASGSQYLQDDQIPAKYYAQIQLQMALSSRSHAVYCVLAPDFLESGAVQHFVIELDAAFVDELMTKCEDVWNAQVWTVLTEKPN